MSAVSGLRGGRWWRRDGASGAVLRPWRQAQPHGLHGQRDDLYGRAPAHLLGKGWASPSAPVSMANVVADVHPSSPAYLLGVEQYGQSCWVDRVIDLPRGPAESVRQVAYSGAITGIWLPADRQPPCPNPRTTIRSGHVVFLPSTVGGVPLGLPETRSASTWFLDIGWDDVTDATCTWLGSATTTRRTPSRHLLTNLSRRSRPRW